MLVAGIIDAGRRNLLRTDHKIHIRCEVSAEDVVEAAAGVVERYGADLISLMDHTPGTRQFSSLDAWRLFYATKTGLPEHELDAFIRRKCDQFEHNYSTNRARLVELARRHRIATASHDDTTLAHVEESIADGVAIAEFPTTLAAASASHSARIAVLVGAPNVVRGGSHSGNVAAEELARHGVLDILSSDYVPASLLFGAFELSRRVESIGLAAAIRTVTLNPARAVGLTDHGEIARGKRADLVRVRLVNDMPVVREVHRGGRRVV